MEFTGATQGLAGTAAVGVLASVVHQEDREVKAPLQFSEVGQQCGDLARVILIDPMESDERIQDQEDGLELLDWLRERIWPYEEAHDANSLRASADLTFAELIRSGSTAALDMGTSGCAAE